MLATIGGIIIGVIVLTVLVALHELGHAIAARRAGVEVKEFGIGFPPRAWARKLKNGTLFTLNWLPLGGFVKLKGEHDAARGKGTYGGVSFGQKTKILLAGVLMNWLTAAALFTVLAWMGLPKILPNQFTIPSDTRMTYGPVEVAYVGKDSPAEKAGIKVGDRITSFGDTVVQTSEQLSNLSKERKGQTLEVVYSRKDQKHSTDVTLNTDNSGGKGFFGVSTGQAAKIHATWSAPIVGVTTTAQFTWETVKGIGGLIGNTIGAIGQKLSMNPGVQKQADKALDEAGKGVVGPIGIFGMLFPNAARGGVPDILMLAAVLSLSLAVMNTLPIPALDGGRWAVTALFRLMKKPLGKELEEKIHGTGMLVLLGLIVLITVLDVSKIIK